MTMPADIFAVTVLSVFCTAGFFVLGVRAARLQRQMLEQQEALLAASQRLALLEGRGGGRSEEPRDFTSSLEEARVKVRLEESGGGRAPGKYRYVASLASRGMGAVEIADVLGISPREAEQLVKLAQVGRGGGSDSA